MGTVATDIAADSCGRDRRRHGGRHRPDRGPGVRYPVQRLFNAGKITWGWQTYAWSGGQWDSRAQLRQVQNGMTVDGAACDRDEAWASDFGQWGASGTGGGGSWPTVQRGATGVAVQTVRYLLNAHGASMAVDGRFGPTAQAAVQNFQWVHGLVVDGIVGPHTWQTLA